MTVYLKCLASRPMATCRLLCIPYAGGGVLAFHAWQSLLPAHVEGYAVQFPGRENRLGEAALTAWQPMMDALTAAVAALPSVPTAILGHSLGALVGVELGRWMHQREPGKLIHLFAAGRPWPGGPGGDAGCGIGALPDPELLSRMDRQYGSLSTSFSHPEIRDLALPILRADLQLLGSYCYRQAPPLDCPLTVFAGSHDPSTPPASLDGWRHETRAAFAVHMLDAGHFFLESHRMQVATHIAAGFQGWAPPQAPSCSRRG